MKSNIIGCIPFVTVALKTHQVLISFDFWCRHGRLELTRFQDKCKWSWWPWASEVATTGAVQRRSSSLWAHRGVYVQQNGTTMDFLEWWLSRSEVLQMQSSKGKKLAYFALVHVRFDLACDLFVVCCIDWWGLWLLCVVWFWAHNIYEEFTFWSS